MIFPDPILLLTSAVCLVFGFSLYLKQQALLKQGTTTRAIIRKSVREQQSGGYVYHPVVEFKTKSNELKVVQLKMGYYWEKTVGSEVNIIYDPEDPETAQINGAFEMVIFPWASMSVGVIALAIWIARFIDS